MADVLIVGAGLAGTSIAWHLAGARRVELIEQGAQIGAEASGQNAGMQRRLAHDPVERQLACRSGTWLAEPPPAFAEGIRRVGGLLLLESEPTSFDEAASDLQRRGVSIEDVTGDPPGLAALDAPHTRAWWVPDEALLDAHHLVGAFWSGARRHGATLTLNRAAHSLVILGGRVIGVETNQGTHFADTVVLATGAWSAQLARRHGLERPLVPLARHLLHTAADPRIRPDHPWVWVDDAGIYVRPEGGGWLCSPCDETCDEPRGSGSAGPVDPVVRALAAAKLATHLPALAEVRFRGGWTGLRTFTPDRRPLIGPDPDLPGLFWATGLGGYGVTCSFAVGEAAANLLTEAPVPWLDLAAVQPGRPYADSLVPATIDLARYAQ